MSLYSKKITPIFLFFGMLIYSIWNFIVLSVISSFSLKIDNLLFLKDIFLLLNLTVIALPILHDGKLRLRSEWRVFFLISLAYVCLILVLTVLSPVSFSNAIFGFRQISFLFVIMIIVLMGDFPANILAQFEAFLKIISVPIFVFGIVEILYSEIIWIQNLNLIGFWNGISFDQSKIINMQDVGRFYSSDLIFLTGEKFRRMISFVLEPTLLGSFWTLIFAYFSFQGKSKWILILSLIGGLLCFSKLFLLSIIIVLFFKIKPRIGYKLVYSGLLVVFFLVGLIYENLGLLHGALSHLFGVYTGAMLLPEYPLGLGVSVGGNRGLADSSIGNGEMGGESGLGNIFAQVGVLGLVHLGLIVALVVRFSIMFERFGDTRCLGAAVVMCCYLSNFIFSASSLGVSIHIFYFVLAALVIKTDKFSYKRFVQGF